MTIGPPPAIGTFAEVIVPSIVACGRSSGAGTPLVSAVAGTAMRRTSAGIRSDDRMSFIGSLAWLG